MVHFLLIIGESGLGQTTLFEHEIGTDQVNPDGSTTTVTSFVKSYDFDLQSRAQNTGNIRTNDSFYLLL